MMQLIPLADLLNNLDILYTLRLTTYTLHLTPYTLHLTPYTNTSILHYFETGFITRSWTTVMKEYGE